MVASSIRIFVVDDFEPFRRFICETLRARPGFEVVGETSDGLEAALMANELRPDLVILDIGLPRLNGIEVAAQIRESCPATKILFVSQESSTDIVRRTFAVGANGYVIKTEASCDLLKAVDEVLKRGQFVSSKLSGFADPRTVKAENPGRELSDFTTSQRRSGGVSAHHQVLFYSDEEYFLDALARLVGSALSAMNSAVVIATEPHRRDLLLRLQASDLEAAIAENRYIALDAASTVSNFMVSGKPDRVRVLRGIGDVFARAMETARGKVPRVAACGECSPLLYAEGKADAAIQIERLTNQVGGLYEVDILCGYSSTVFQGKEGRSALQQIQAEHSVTHRQPEQLIANNDYRAKI